LEITSPGFQPYTATELHLVARQTLRLDVSLQVGQVSSTVEVQALAGVITTDTPTIQSNLDGNALLTLPGNVRGGNGSTSPYALIATLPGVQPDDSGNFSIQGGLQSMSQFSVDGISISNVGGNSPLTEAFPSLESIQEIKVQGVATRPSTLRLATSPRFPRAEPTKFTVICSGTSRTATSMPPRSVRRSDRR
jgi:hypothetical protein